MPTYFDFVVAIQEIKPRIWRRFLLPKTATFHDLHMAIQDSFGWENCHLFEFSDGGFEGDQIAGSPQTELPLFGEEVPPATTVRLSSYFAEGRRICTYLYDFGDSWCHEVCLRGMVEDKEAFKRRLLDGARACPQEDSGGIGGYRRFSKIVNTGKDPYGEDVEEALEWLDGWDPETFDLAKAKAKFDKKGGKGSSKARR
ncbi:MAG: plasmid pRiA4b ORF-3 family protein [Deltaproteobacteria bacterium]|nr:plasmid pRiA4b ORF-3 family protein [Deltaproteobacteria bacterium]